MHLEKLFITSALKQQIHVSRLFPTAIFHIHRQRPLRISHKLPQQQISNAAESLPRAAQPSIWHSIIPKALRSSRQSTGTSKRQAKREWNPATFFIVIFLLIGSNAIQMIALRSEYLAFSRKAEAKIGLLKEVIERVQKGEDVDVEGLLGTGDEEQEREWEEVIREIEEADRNWEPNARRRKDRRGPESSPGNTSEIGPGNQADIGTTNKMSRSADVTFPPDQQTKGNTTTETKQPNRSPGFY